MTSILRSCGSEHGTSSYGVAGAQHVRCRGRGLCERVVGGLESAATRKGFRMSRAVAGGREVLPQPHGARGRRQPHPGDGERRIAACTEGTAPRTGTMFPRAAAIASERERRCPAVPPNSSTTMPVAHSTCAPTKGSSAGHAHKHRIRDRRRPDRTDRRSPYTRSALDLAHAALWVTCTPDSRRSVLPASPVGPTQCGSWDAHRPALMPGDRAPAWNGQASWNGTGALHYSWAEHTTMCVIMVHVFRACARDRVKPRDFSACRTARGDGMITAKCRCRNVAD
jgi:hypothetical protein